MYTHSSKYSLLVDKVVATKNPWAWPRPLVLLATAAHKQCSYYVPLLWMRIKVTMGIWKLSCFCTCTTDWSIQGAHDMPQGQWEERPSTSRPNSAALWWRASHHQATRLLCTHLMFDFHLGSVIHQVNVILTTVPQKRASCWHHTASRLRCLCVRPSCISHVFSLAALYSITPPFFFAQKRVFPRCIQCICQL